MSKIFRTFAADLALMVSNIDLRKLELGKHELDFQLDSSYFAAQEKSEILSGKVDCHAVLNLREDDYDLFVAANGTVQVTCDRCLDPMDIEVEIEEDIEPEDTPTLDLEWTAYELIVVHLPLVHSHPEGECNPAMQTLLQAHLCSAPEDPEQL